MRRTTHFLAVSAAPVLAAIALAVAVCAWQSAVVSADTTPSVVSSACDSRMIPQGSAFWGHLGSLLAQLVENAPYTPTFSFKTRYGGGEAPAFGEAHCSSSCSPGSCRTCLQQLSYDIWQICNNALGADVNYPDCGIHYECYYF